MTWVTPAAIDLRLGFEITSYVAHRWSRRPPAVSAGGSLPDAARYPTGADPRIACTRQESVTARAPA